jgi:hypothetical protein
MTTNEAKKPDLLSASEHERTCSLRGMSYVINSVGDSDNLSFFVSVYVNTADNTTVVKYSIRVFKDRTDQFIQSYTNYQEAIDKYNELAIKWNGYREPI